MLLFGEVVLERPLGHSPHRTHAIDCFDRSVTCATKAVIREAVSGLRKLRATFCSSSCNGFVLPRFL